MRAKIARMSVHDAAVGAPAADANGAAPAGTDLQHAAGSLRWSKATRDCPTA